MLVAFPLFFTAVILVGSAMLVLPASWAGDGRLSYLDALFTATSAVCTRHGAPVARTSVAVSSRGAGRRPARTRLAKPHNRAGRTMTFK